MNKLQIGVVANNRKKKFLKVVLSYLLVYGFTC